MGKDDDGGAVARPGLQRGWSAKVVLPTQSMGDNHLVYICNISKSGVQQLGADLAANGKAAKLELRHSYVGPEGTALLAEGLATNDGLRSLNLRNSEVGDHGAVALGTKLVTQTTLQDLNLCTNGIGDIGAEALASYLRSSKTIRSLLLRDNRIGRRGGRNLGEALRENSSLQTLALGINDVADDGAKYISEALVANPLCPLRNLDLGTNSVTDVGCEDLHLALKREGCAIERLELRNNRISDEGLRHICEAMTLNTTSKLKDLDMSMNAVGDPGAESLALMLLKNTVLQQLKLQDNFITDEGAEEMLRLMTRGATPSETSIGLQLIKLDMGGNLLSETETLKFNIFMKTHAQDLKNRRGNGGMRRRTQGTSKLSVDSGGSSMRADTKTSVGTRTTSKGAESDASGEGRKKKVKDDRPAAPPKIAKSGNVVPDHVIAELKGGGGRK